MFGRDSPDSKFHRGRRRCRTIPVDVSTYRGRFLVLDANCGGGLVPAGADMDRRWPLGTLPKAATEGRGRLSLRAENEVR